MFRAPARAVWPFFLRTATGRRRKAGAAPRPAGRLRALAGSCPGLDSIAVVTSNYIICIRPAGLIGPRRLPVID